MASHPSDALAVALKFLGLRPRSVFEIKKKLGDKGFEVEDIEKTVRALTEALYLDDEKYAATVAASRSRYKNWGPLKIANELRAKGVKDEFIRKALGDAKDGESSTASLALDKWKKRNKLKAPLDRDASARAFRFLKSRGFSSEACMRAIGSRHEPDEE